MRSSPPKALRPRGVHGDRYKHELFMARRQANGGEHRVRTSRFRFSQIVQVTFHDKRRSTKLRPALIIDDYYYALWLERSLRLLPGENDSSAELWV